MLFERITQAITQAPVTHLPALLRCVVEQCSGARGNKHRVFKSNEDLLKFVARVLEHFPDPPKKRVCMKCGGRTGWVVPVQDEEGVLMGADFKTCPVCHGKGEV